MKRRNGDLRRRGRRRRSRGEKQNRPRNTVCHLERGVHRATVMIKRLINFRLAAMKPVHANDHNGVSAAITTRSITLINRIQLIYICMTSSARSSAPFIPYSPSLRTTPIDHLKPPFIFLPLSVRARVYPRFSRTEFFHRVCR